MLVFLRRRTTCKFFLVFLGSRHRHSTPQQSPRQHFIPLYLAYIQRDDGHTIHGHSPKEVMQGLTSTEPGTPPSPAPCPPQLSLADLRHYRFWDQRCISENGEQNNLNTTQDHAYFCLVFRGHQRKGGYGIWYPQVINPGAQHPPFKF